MRAGLVGAAFDFENADQFLPRAAKFNIRLGSKAYGGAAFQDEHVALVCRGFGLAFINQFVRLGEVDEDLLDFLRGEFADFVHPRSLPLAAGFSKHGAQKRLTIGAGRPFQRVTHEAIDQNAQVQAEVFRRSVVIPPDAKRGLDLAQPFIGETGQEAIVVEQLRLLLQELRVSEDFRW